MVEQSQIPQFLLHKVFALNPEYAEAGALENIKKKGLIPRVPCEWARKLPEALRYRPAVWLAETMINQDGTIVYIHTLMLDRVRLFKLDWEDVGWWLYQGTIPSRAIGFSAM